MGGGGGGTVSPGDLSWEEGGWDCESWGPVVGGGEGGTVSPGDLSWEEGGGGTVSPWTCGGLVGGEDICCIAGVWPKRGVCALINTCL